MLTRGRGEKGSRIEGEAFRLAKGRPGLEKGQVGEFGFPGAFI